MNEYFELKGNGMKYKIFAKKGKYNAVLFWKIVDLMNIKILYLYSQYFLDF